MIEQGRIPEETRPLELLNAEVAEKVAYVYLMALKGSSLAEKVKFKIHGKSLEEIARTVNNSVIGLRSFRELTGEVIVNGKPIKVTSQPFDVSGIGFIDGQVFTPNIESLEQSQKNLGTQRFVYTRLGTVEIFEDQDFIISTGQQNEQQTQDRV